MTSPKRKFETYLSHNPEYDGNSRFVIHIHDTVTNLGGKHEIDIKVHI